MKVVIFLPPTYLIDDVIAQTVKYFWELQAGPKSGSVIIFQKIAHQSLRLGLQIKKSVKSLFLEELEKSVCNTDHLLLDVKQGLALNSFYSSTSWLTKSRITIFLCATAWTSTQY